MVFFCFVVIFHYIYRRIRLVAIRTVAHREGTRGKKGEYDEEKHIVWLYRCENDDDGIRGVP